MRTISFEFTITGLIIGIIVVGMLASSFAFFTAGLESKFNVTGNTSFGRYNQTQDIVDYAKEVNESIHFTQETSGIIDMVGAYFSSGYSALKIAVKSFGIFNSLMDEASNDFEYFAFFKNLFVVLVVIIIVLLIISVLVKWRI